VGPEARAEERWSAQIGNATVYLGQSCALPSAWWVCMCSATQFCSVSCSSRGQGAGAWRQPAGLAHLSPCVVPAPPQPTPHTPTPLPRTAPGLGLSPTVALLRQPFLPAGVAPTPLQQVRRAQLGHMRGAAHACGPAVVRPVLGCSMAGWCSLCSLSREWPCMLMPLFVEAPGGLSDYVQDDAVVALPASSSCSQS
jgi:hypothetical protein